MFYISVMTIQYCSDLHLEQPENAKWLRANPLIPKAEVLVLAGDIIPFVEMELAQEFFDRVSDQFKVVYWLPGNHEYFGSDITERSGAFREAIRSNVILLNNTVERLEEVSFIFSTLWSNVTPAAEWQVSRAVTDYRYIQYNGERFLPLHGNRLHRACRRFIEEAVAGEVGGLTIGGGEGNPTGSRIVVTHHVPTFMHYPKQFRGSVINEAFATEMSEFIALSPISAWIYGHHHENVPEFLIGNTRMLTNQLGYVRKREYYGFRREGMIIL